MTAWWYGLDPQGRGLLAAIAVVLALALALVLLVRWLRPRPAYEAVDSLFTASELTFLHVLETAVDGRARVYGKVRIADLVRVASNVPRGYFLSAFNPIAQKHVDYVICHPHDLAVLCVVELDDPSHRRPERQARDALVDSVMASAGIPILHVPTQPDYDVRILQEMLDDLLPHDAVAPV